MKNKIISKLALFFIALFAISSCEHNPVTEKNYDPYPSSVSSINSNFVITKKTEYSQYGQIYRVMEFTYNNHYYILFQDGFGECARSGVVHSPDCQCGLN